MKRLCVFAHWDKDNIVDDYVIYYLNALKDVADTIIFVSDCNLSEDEKSKLTGIADYVLAEKHGEYDFGSYKRGFFFAKERNLEFDELIFANDSVFGPIYSLVHVFDKMKKKKCDFWGLMKNRFGIIREPKINVARFEPHVHSYFILLKKQVFESNVFVNFMQNVKQEPDKESIVTKYEVGLSRELSANGFKYDVCFKQYGHTNNVLSAKWNKLITKYKFPFIKTSILRYGIYVTGEVTDWEKVLSKVSDYPVEIIKKNLSRYTIKEPNLFAKYSPAKKIRFILHDNVPLEIRKILIILEKSINTLCFNKLNKL